MAKASEINLIKTKTMISPQLMAMEEQVRSASVLMLVGIFSASLFFGVGYVMIARRYAALSLQKQALMSAVEEDRSTEGLYVSLRERIGIISRVLEKQRSWSEVLDLIDRVTGSGAMTSFTVDEKNEVHLSLTSQTLEDALGMVDRLRSEVVRRKIANPILESVQYRKDGTVRLAVTFAPIF